MKKLTKIVSLILALVLVIGASAMPAFAGVVLPEWMPDGYSGNEERFYSSKYNTCVFIAESKRDWALRSIQNGKYAKMYYMDANGDLYTDMPKYGGTMVAKNGSAEKEFALYGTVKKTLWYDSWKSICNSYTLTYRHGMGTPNTQSAGFTDVADGA